MQVETMEGYGNRQRRCNAPGAYVVARWQAFWPLLSKQMEPQPRVQASFVTIYVTPLSLLIRPSLLSGLDDHLYGHPLMEFSHEEILPAPRNSYGKACRKPR